jgi:uncharacterized SAM-binding protein YcdF (DUF218 family)
VKKFVRDFGDVVFVSNDEKDFIEKARNILRAPLNAEFRQKARFIAEGNSWERRIKEMSDIIEKEMVKREASALGGWKDNFRRIIKAAQKKVSVSVVALAVCYGLVFHTAFLWWVASPLKISSPLANCDAIVALGGGVGETGRAGQGYEERVEYAAWLYNKGYAKKIIFSSGFVYALQEADVMKALAVSLGVAPNDIILEKQSKNTYENVKNSLSISKTAGFKHIIFISSPYHMLRVKMVADKIGKEYSFVYSPIPHSLFYGDGKTVHPRHVKAIVHEYMSLVWYWLKGYA